MQTVKLTPKTRKGQNVTRQNGETWEVVKVQDSILFSTQPGPWLFVKPTVGDLRNTRWVHGTDDPNFTVEA